jgi:FtsZ-binding cell division protein ZapB
MLVEMNLEMVNQIDCLEIRCKGIELEYNYVNNLKDKRIMELRREIENLQKSHLELRIENEDLKKQLEECRSKLLSYESKK